MSEGRDCLLSHRLPSSCQWPMGRQEADKKGSWVRWVGPSRQCSGSKGHQFQKCRLDVALHLQKGISNLLAEAWQQSLSMAKIRPARLHSSSVSALLLTPWPFCSLSLWNTLISYLPGIFGFVLENSIYLPPAPRKFSLTPEMESLTLFIKCILLLIYVPKAAQLICLFDLFISFL